MKIAICDDEPYIRTYLSSLIRKQDAAAVIKEYAAAEDYLSDQEDYDLLFLDIELSLPEPKDKTCRPAADKSDPENDSKPHRAFINGMELARLIRARTDRPQPLLIFVTGHETYVYDAFDVNAFHYLLKPVDELRFAAIYQRAARQIAAEEDRQKKKLVVQYAGKTQILPLSNLYYMESRGHKVVLHLKDTSLEYYARLGDLELELQEQFCRIHKGFLINLAHVESYTKTEVTLTNGVKLNLSKYKYEAFVKAHLHYMQFAEP